MEELGELFSDGELALAVSGVSDNFRIDGRSCFDIRKIKVLTGVVSGCYGSAQVKSKNCNITVGVKAEICAPSPDEPDCGIVEINADCSANAHPKFEGRGGDDITQEIVFMLANSIIPTIDKRSLCISIGHKVWAIFVDILVLECSCVSQLIDLSAIGVKAALYNTRVPNYVADEEDASQYVLSPEMEKCAPIDSAYLPILLTLTRIHDQYVADVTEEEASAGIARLTLAFGPTGQLIYLKKSGSGSLHPDPMKEILGKTKRLASEIQANIDKQLESQIKQHTLEHRK